MKAKAREAGPIFPSGLLRILGALMAGALLGSCQAEQEAGRAQKSEASVVPTTDCVDLAQVDYGDLPFLARVGDLAPAKRASLSPGVLDADGPCSVPPGVADDGDCATENTDGVWYSVFNGEVSQKWLPVAPGRRLPLGLRPDHDLADARGVLLQRGLRPSEGVDFGQPYLHLSLCDDDISDFSVVFDPTGRRLLYLHLRATVV